MAGRNASIKIGADLTELQKQLKQAVANIKDTKRELELSKSSFLNFANSTESLSQVISKQEKVLDAHANKVSILTKELEKAKNAENVNAEQVERLSKQLVTAQTQYNKAKNTLSEYKAQFEQLNKAQKEGGTEIGKLNSKIEENKEKLAKAKTEYQNYILKHQQNSKEAKKVKDEIKRLSAELDDNQKELKQSSDEVEKLSGSFEELGKKSLIDMSHVFSHVVYDVAKGFARQIGGTIKNEISSAFNVGMNFESAFAGVKKVVDGTEEDFARLEKQIRETASVKPVSADAIADVYRMGAQLGIAQKDLNDFANTIIELKDTSNLTEEAGATMIAQYANVAKLPSEEYRKFASTLSYLGSTTATTEADIMSIVQRMQGTTSVFNMAHKDVLALATAMGSVGLTAEAGGSAMSKVMMSIETAVANNNDELKVWADTARMSTTEFSDMWRSNVLGAIQAVMRGLADEKAGGESLVLLLEDLGITNIRTTQTMLQMTGAADMLTETMSKANNEWEKSTFLSQSADNAYKTTAAQLQMMKNSYDDLKISIYKSLQEPMQDVIQTITKLLKSPEIKDGITNLVKKLADGFSQVLKNTDQLARNIKAVGAAVAGFIATFAIAKVVTGVASLVAVVIKLVTGIKAATTAQGIFNAVLAANPFGAIATAIGLVITAIVSLGIATDGFKSKEERAIATVEKHTQALKEQKKQLEENAETRNNTIKGIDNECNRYQSLINELKTLVDENGRVKEGYKSRVNEIIPILSEATGTEIRLIDNQIQGYNNLLTTLDQVIAKKRAEAKISAYDEDYKDAIKNQDSLKEEYNTKITELVSLKKEREAIREQAERARATRQWTDKTLHAYNKLNKEIEAKEDEQRALWEVLSGYEDTIQNYEKMYGEYYEKYMQPSKTTNSVDVEVSATVDQKSLDNVNKTIKESTKKSVDNTKKELEQLSTNSMVTPQVELTDDSYAGLKRQEAELLGQLNQMQQEVVNGNTAITETMLNNINKQIDVVQGKISELKNEWADSGEDENEIADEFQIDNFRSTGVIFGKGVLGEEAQEYEGMGKDAASAYLDGYQAQKALNEELLAAQIPLDVANETAMRNMAELDPVNLESRGTTQAFIAEHETIQHAQGINDNQYRIIDAETQALNAAKTEAMKIDFTSIGMYICMGIADGIRQNTYMIVSAVREAMEAAQSEAEDANDINSPSKVYWGYGKYIDEGFANGIRDNAKLARNEMQELSLSLQKSAQLIKPNIELELGDLKAGVQGEGSTVYNLTQNINSPKALDTLTLYNETKSLLKRTVRDKYYV